jgi:aspartate dehydrogenase
MPKLLKIGIVGCGAIGSSLAKSISKDFKKQAKLAALYDIDIFKAKDLAQKVSGGRSLVCFGLKQLIFRSDLVIEAASAKSSLGIAKASLRMKRDVMIMSVGGIVSDFKKLEALTRKNNCKIFIPSGAISGIDALKAARLDNIKTVTLTTTKNPLSFEGVEYVRKKKIDLAKIKKDKVLFSGSAAEAVKYFPQNINVAAVLSIAGIGKEKTLVKIIASPSAKKNIHQIEIESSAGRILTRTENILHPENPKTSYLAVLSAIATLEGVLSPVKIGT